MVKCRHCQNELRHPFIDLGSAPPSNRYLKLSELEALEPWLPLKTMVCENCWLVQTIDFTGRENLFDAEYAYFSSYSSTWLEHARCYVEDAIARFNLNSQSHVIEVASNDGYLLQYFLKKGVPCLGIEPTESTAAAARKIGIPVIGNFFGVDLAEVILAQGKQADLMIANNVLAHVPDINDFVSGFAKLLKPSGVASFEFPHLQNLVQFNQFDTIYHEHYSYLSLTALMSIFERAGLKIFDVQNLSTHGGSLRVWVTHIESQDQPVQHTVSDVLEQERVSGLSTLEYYQSAQSRAFAVKLDLLNFLVEQAKAGKTVAAYGAAAKGNTLLNYSGVSSDLIEFVVDLNPQKQGKFLPGSRIPIVDLQHLFSHQPDFLIILPWNLNQEIRALLQGKLERTRLVTCIPSLAIDEA